MKSFLKKFQLVEGSKLVFARWFTDGIFVLGNFKAIVGVRPFVSGRGAKLPSESLRRPFVLPLYRPV